MKFSVTITKEIEEWWGITDDMTDEEIVALLKEDIVAVLDGAEWIVFRQLVD